MGEEGSTGLSDRMKRNMRLTKRTSKKMTKRTMKGTKLKRMMKGKMKTMRTRSKMRTRRTCGMAYKAWVDKAWDIRRACMACDGAA